MKKALRKGLSVILAITIIFSSAYVGLGEVDFSGIKSKAASTSDLTFALNSEGNSYSVTDCDTYASGSITIPSTYDGMPVTSIGDKAFYYCRSLTSITIPDSVTSIGDYAFGDCTGLTSITIPDSVTSIGDWAFYYCTGLTSITIPDGVTSIGEYAFYDCYYLTSITIPDSVTSIGERAFYDCYNLTSITIPDSVTSIGERAFSYCKGLTSITIPDSVTSIRNYAFYYCTGLTSITIPDSVTSIGNSAFYWCTSLTSIEIPDSVTSIGDGAFQGCSKLTSITIPDSVTSIGDRAFEYCTSLTSINVDSGNMNYASVDGVLFNKDKTTLLQYPIGKTGTSYVIPNSVTSIGNAAFYYCRSLTSITIPDSVTSIGERAFDYCTGLTSITIPDSVTSIGSYAFQYCYDLTSVTIGKGVTSIGEYAFYDCDNLTSITIPDSVTSIGDWAFCSCSSLTSITIPDSVTSIGNSAFEDCSKLTSITIPDSVTSIDDYTFYYCTGLTTITIPASVTSIGESAFYECTSLKDVYYGGTEADWENITIGSDNNYLTNATIHYHQHTCIDWVVDKAPTCTEAGTKYSECSDCGEAVIEEIDATGHDFSEEWTIDKEPTYTENGSKSRHCLNCDAKTDVTEIPAQDFNNVMYVVQEGSTCNGKITYVVYLKAGTSVNGAIINAEFDDAALDVSEGGAYTVTDSYGDPIPKVSGIYESGLCWNKTNMYSMAFVNTTVYSPSKDTPFMKITFDIIGDSTEAAVKFTCKEFNGNNPEQNIPNTETPVMIFEETADITIDEHISSDWIVDDVATVFDVGYEHRECVNCGEFLETKIIPQLICQEPELKEIVQNEDGLEFSWNAVEGADLYRIYRKTDSTEWLLFAEVESDSTTYVDVDVNKDKVYYYTVQAINEAGASSYNSNGLGCEFHIHSFGDWEVTTPATCTTTGEQIRVCSDCGDEEIGTIDSFGHDYSTEWTIDVEPTCTEDGSKSHHCSRCESITDVTVIEPISHSYGDWVITKTPTCTGQGSLSKTCSVCGDVKTEAIAKNPHSYSTEWTIDLEATCTENGSKSHHCTACGDKADVTVIQANGHSYGDWFTSTEPTCTDDGSKYKVCSACSDVVTETIGFVGHKYSTEWTIDVEPTCTQDGSKSHHCITCGDKADVTVINATGHNYEIKNVAEEHPHTITYQCSYCVETKTEQETASDCLECNFTITYVKETDSYKVVSYTGSQENAVIPATYNGCTVTTIANGCFKGNTSIKSVEIADGVASIGSLAFMNCTSLEKVVIPASVTTIGSQAFYGFTGTIYCTRDSFAHEYADANNIKYFLLSILETENTKIDYDNFLIFTDVRNSDDVFDILGVSETALAIPVASIVYGNLEIYGTGTVITVFDGNDYVGDFTLIVDGDLNGDATCDVIDAATAHLYSVGLEEPSENEILAANGCISDELDAESYQNVVNICLAS